MNWLRKRVADGSLLFGLLPIIYFLLYGFDGFADTDEGFVPGLAWRVKLGQVPYLDFVYVRPPLTPVLHALELWLWPVRGQVLAMRFDYYLMMAGSVFFGILTLRRWFDFQKIGIQPWMLGVLAFLFSVHNYPAMPWHTVDGIFFGSLGILLLTRLDSEWRMVAGLFALALAGLAKQPFALMLPLGFFGAIGMLPWRSALRVCLFAIGGMAGAVAILLSTLPPGFWGAMTTQIMGASSLTELAKAGILGYLMPLAIFVVPSALLLRWSSSKAQPATQKGLLYAFWFALALVPVAHAGLAFWKMSFMPPRLGIYHALWFAGIGFSLLQWRAGERKASLVLLLMSALAWTSSLSWGYPVPVLFALPGLFGFFGLLRAAFPDLQIGMAMVRSCIGLAFVGFFLLHLFPYRDAPRWELKSGAGEIFPQLSGIRMGQESLEKLQELSVLNDRYAGKIVVLPAQPGISYLTQRPSLLAVDWEHDAEIGPSQMKGLLQQLSALHCFAIVEKSRLAEAEVVDSPYGSKVLKSVLDNWTKVDSVPHFDVFALHPSP